MSEQELPRKTLVYILDPEVYDQFVADIDQPCLGTNLEKLFERPSPFTKDCE